LAAKLDAVVAERASNGAQFLEGEDLAEKREREHGQGFEKKRGNHYGNEFAEMQRARLLMAQEDEEEEARLDALAGL
jgi:hypothetical protein